MKSLSLPFSIICLFLSIHTNAQNIHVFVALCDNEFQGIVPVNDRLGNGKNPNSNLYWGAGYGVRNFFKVKSPHWKFVQKLEPIDSLILERLLFQHIESGHYLLADAYDGEFIKECTVDFLYAANGQQPDCISVDTRTIDFGGDADLVAYVGHDGLMDFDVSIDYIDGGYARDVMILACSSAYFFDDEIRRAGARPVLWTTQLMAPEAYTLEAAVEAWIQTKELEQIERAAEEAYMKYQKSSKWWTKDLFVSGFDQLAD